MNQHQDQSSMPNGKQQHEVTELSSPPEIPHITANMIPLSNIIKYYTQEAYKQLTTAIENLSMNVNEESDIKRKKYFLNVIINLRQDFIKVYTLIKWASISKDVSKFIDLLNWFRIQEFHFENLIFQLNALTGYNAAKLPNSDIITALEVLYHGRPKLPSYNYIKSDNLSPQKILETLNDLNLVLMTRFALMDNIPKRFDYEIKDGRAYIRVSNEFEVSITVGNDLIIDNPEEYYKSPFYFIDFKFLFGANPESGLITFNDDKISTKLPTSLHKKLEKLVNQTLLTRGLQGLYELLHKYSNSFKIYLLAKQFQTLLINSRWRGNFQINYQTNKSLIVINYWSQHYLSRNWKSFIELGIDSHSNLNYRWFKNGQYCFGDQGNNELDKIFHLQRRNSNNGVTTSSNTISTSAMIAGIRRSTELSNETAIVDDNDNDNDDTNNTGETENEDLNVDLILNVVVNQHAKSIMSEIYSQLLTRFSETDVSMVSPHQLLLQISPKKSTVFAINPLTGFFYFIDPTPIQTYITKKINSPPPTLSQVSIKQSFIPESDMISYVIDQIIQLRLEVFNKEVNTKLATTAWINNGIIKLSDHELSKLTQFLIQNEEQEGDDNEEDSSTNTRLDSVLQSFKVQFYRRKNWPSSWFLINMISGVTTKSFWWVARIKSISGDWKIQWAQIIKFHGDNAKQELSPNESKVFDKPKRTVDCSIESEQLNYEFFKTLSTLSSNLILDHMILEELQVRSIKFIKLDWETIDDNKIFLKFKQNHDISLKRKNSHNINIDVNVDVADNTSTTTNTKYIRAPKLKYESMFLIYNDKLLPIYNSATILFLKIELVESNKMYLKLFGNLRNLQIKNTSEDIQKLHLNIDEANQYFEIDNTVDLSTVINEPKTLLLNLIFNTLNKLNSLIKILDQLNKSNVTVLDNSMDNITINIKDKYNDNNDKLIIIKLPEQATDSIQLLMKNGSTTTTDEIDLRNNNILEFELILKFLNQYLRESKLNNHNRQQISIIKIIQYLTEINPILQSTKAINQQLAELKRINSTNNNNNNAKRRSILKLSNGLYKLYFNLNIISLTHLQLVFFMNSNTGSNLKKIQRDKIMINLSLIKFDRFSKPNGNFQDSTNGHLIKISFKDSLINENLKFKNLFEIIFKNINELLITKSKQIKSLNQTENQQQQQPLKQEDNSDSAIIKKESQSIEDDLLDFGEYDNDIKPQQQEPQQNEKENSKTTSKENETVRPDDILIKLNYDYLLSMNNLQLMINEITKSCFQYLQQQQE